jgi:uncharacterized membrane protein YccC
MLDDDSSQRAAPLQASGKGNDAAGTGTRADRSATALAFANVADAARDGAFALARELAAWRASPERVAFGAQAVLSVGLSVLVARALHVPYAWWVAISGFAVMQGSLAASAQRGLQRVLGTVLGAVLGALVGPWVGGLPWLFVPVLGVIGGVTVYCALGSDAMYAWILGGVTAVMVAFEAHMLVLVQASAKFAALRVVEVIIGTCACVLIAALFQLGVAHRDKAWPRRGWAAAWSTHRDWLTRAVVSVTDNESSVTAPSGPSEAPVIVLEPATFPAARWRVAIQCGVSIAILAALAYVLNLPSFEQAIVTTIAVVALPAASIAKDATRSVLEKIVQRIAGCLLAGAVAVVLLPLLRGEPIACMIALMLGVWVGCHVQTGRKGASYIGRQFTIAFIMVFVQDHKWAADPQPALLRLAGILAGVVVTAGVMLVSAGRVGGAMHRA